MTGFGLDEPLLTVEDAARLLSVKPSTVYEWVRSGWMPHLRIGPRAIRFTRPMLAEWVESRRVDLGARRLPVDRSRKPPAFRP